jgi:hypothetical protein
LSTRRLLMAGNGSTVQISLAHAEYLSLRGAHSHRGKATFARSAVAGRLLDALRDYQEVTDPRLTRGLSDELHAFVVRLLPQPWALRRFEIEHLEGFLATTPGFKEAAAATGFDPAAVLGEIGAWTSAEKLTLVDHAIQHQAPAAAGGSFSASSGR